MTKFPDTSGKFLLLKAVPRAEEGNERVPVEPASATGAGRAASNPVDTDRAAQSTVSRAFGPISADIRLDRPKTDAAGVKQPDGAPTPKAPSGSALPAQQLNPSRRTGALVVPATPRPGTSVVAGAGLQRPPARPFPVTTASAEPRPQQALPVGLFRAASEKRPGARSGVPSQSADLALAPKPALSGQTTAEDRPVAAAARMRRRHHGILASFVVLVLLPIIAAASYLWVVAVDQYSSTVGFSVRTEELSSSLDLLGGITRLSGGGSSDSDILYDYIHSQELVTDLDAQIDLRGIYAQVWPSDPIFAFDPDGSVEDLVNHWEKKVRILYDANSGLMTLRVLAFSPEQATMVAARILERSTEKINALTSEAREDATRYARIEMDRALDRLKTAREAMTDFRMRTQMVDPIVDLQGQMGILNSLQAQLAESYIELDLLRVTTNTIDPRVVRVEQRIAVIKNRMEEERRKFSESDQGSGGEDYASMVAEFERLTVDREFAEEAYRVALAAYDAALAEAQRKSRYLAAHIKPTMAEKAEYPQRWTLLGLTAFFALMAWAIGVLVYYSIRDRR